MPKFTISKDGQTLTSLQLDSERIELGSANTCSLFIDDLLLSLHQAAFLKSDDGYDIEPIARTPVFTMNGQVVDQRMKVVPDAVIEVEGYEIRVETGAVMAAGSAPRVPEPLDLPPEPPPLPPVEAPKEPPPTPAYKAPPVPTAEEKPTPPSPPREKSLPPLPPPLPSIPEPISGPAPEPPPLEPPPPQPPVAESPPPMPPLPPPMEDGGSGGEAPTMYVIPTKPIGQLVATAGPLQGKSWPLAGSELRIGREQNENDILLRFDPQGEIDTSISRRHASIHIEGDFAYVEDMGSVAGTFVNGRQINAGERIPLRSGDEIEIRSAKVSTVFRVELGQPSAAPSPSLSAPPPMPEPRRDPIPRPPPPPPASQFEPPPEPQYASATPLAEEPRGREPRRQRERARPALDEDNPFAPREETGMPRWIWFAIGGVVIVIAVVLVYLLT